MEYFGKNLSDLRKKEPLSCKHANTTIPIDFSIKNLFTSDLHHKQRSSKWDNVRAIAHLQIVETDPPQVKKQLHLQINKNYKLTSPSLSK